MASHEARLNGSTSFARRLNLAARAWIGDARPKLLGTVGLRVVISSYRYSDCMFAARSPGGYAAESICNSPEELAATDPEHVWARFTESAASKGRSVQTADMIYEQ